MKKLLFHGSFSSSPEEIEALKSLLREKGVEILDSTLCETKLIPDDYEEVIVYSNSDEEQPLYLITDDEQTDYEIPDEEANKPLTSEQTDALQKEGICNYVSHLHPNAARYGASLIDSTPNGAEILAAHEGFATSSDITGIAHDTQDDTPESFFFYLQVPRELAEKLRE
jgi:hypothetical protein